MKQPTHPIRDRWTAQPLGDSDEALAGALWRSAEVQPFGAKNLASVGARLRDKERKSPRRWAWQLAIVVGLLLCGGVLSASVMHVLRRVPTAVSQPSTPAPPPASRPRPTAGTNARTVKAIPDPVAALPLAPELPPVPRGPEVRAPRQAYSRGKPEPNPARPEPPPVPPAVPDPSALAQESRLVAGAIHKLREERDPQRALALLDEHRDRFGAHGALVPEAQVTRIEALLRLGRHDQALVLLDGLDPKPAGVGREMLVARAELRAEKGRRTAALNDFSALLGSDAPSDPVTERALYGRATCRAQGGDRAGASADLDCYLARFPAGRFAKEARAAMDR